DADHVLEQQQDTQAQQDQQTSLHDALFHALGQAAAAQHFDEQQQQVAAVQGGQRQDVDQGQVDAQHGAVEEQVLEAHLGQLDPLMHGHHGAAHVLPGP